MVLGDASRVSDKRLAAQSLRVRGQFCAAQYTDSMRIPHTKLSSAVLRAIVEEFVTRDGTDHSSVERRIDMVLLQLHAGRAELHFDGETQTCNILPLKENPSSGGRDE